MAITPTGSPAWTRTAGISQYGGNVDKRNYMGIGPIDALTDWSAEEFCRMTADVVAMVRTSAFAAMTVLCNDTSPAAPTIEFVCLMTGVRTTSYAGDAAPSGFPSASRNGDGDVTITFASSYADEYGVSASYAPTQAKASAHATSAVARVSTAEISGQTVRVRTVLGNTGAAVADARFTLEVH